MSNVYLEVARAPRKCHFGDHLIPKGTQRLSRQEYPQKDIGLFNIFAHAASKHLSRKEHYELNTFRMHNRRA
jgi:Zn-dependent membrane protease YugP